MKNTAMRDALVKASTKKVADKPVKPITKAELRARLQALENAGLLKRADRQDIPGVTCYWAGSRLAPWSGADKGDYWRVSFRIAEDDASVIITGRGLLDSERMERATVSAKAIAKYLRDGGVLKVPDPPRPARAMGIRITAD